MAKERHQQVSLGPIQPPFPGGWVSLLLRTLGSFSTDLAKRHGLPKRWRTFDRLASGNDEVKEATYLGWRTKLVEIVRNLFPWVSAINDFPDKYVDEYLHLWALSAENAPRWVEISGCTAASRQVLARAHLRDLFLRLCYLESCERRLAERSDTPLVQSASFEEFYGLLVHRRKPAKPDAEEALAAELKVSSRTIRRWLSGAATPSWQNLRDLVPQSDGRIAGGLGFIDALLRRLALRDGPLAGELLQVAGGFGTEHPTALSEFRGEVPITEGASEMREVGFEEFARFKGNLLLHPGWERVQAAMPDSLWRVHVHALRFARPFELPKPTPDMPNPRAINH